MHKSLAISFQKVSKSYQLYDSKRDQIISVLGLTKLGFKTKSQPKLFRALDNISLEVPKGKRVGIVGRNGAGKTTLLKLICGNFQGSSGKISINGEVQALMSVGLGFHPEFTGRENIRASLLYSGLNKNQHVDIIDDIISFCELGEFIDQPFKTYSSGMQARLMFASATAINPDILIVDEMLGAGDAYFIAKSRKRVDKLIQSGCTMLLVSHSMSQILELCNEVIWLDKGKIKMRGEAFAVVKAYEQFIYGQNEQKTLEKVNLDNNKKKPKHVTREKLSQRVKEINFQEPFFLPHLEKVNYHNQKPISNFDFLARGGLSRWAREFGLKFSGFTITSRDKITDELISLQPADFIFTVRAEIDGTFDCRYSFDLYNHLGNLVTVIVSSRDKFYLKNNNERTVTLSLNPLQIGPGDYTLSLSIHEYSHIELMSSVKRYDLLNRSFSFTVELPETLNPIKADFFHSAEWVFK